MRMLGDAKRCQPCGLGAAGCRHELRRTDLCSFNQQNGARSPTQAVRTCRQLKIVVPVLSHVRPPAVTTTGKTGLSSSDIVEAWTQQLRVGLSATLAALMVVVSSLSTPQQTQAAAVVGYGSVTVNEAGKLKEAWGALPRSTVPKFLARATAAVRANAAETTLTRSCLLWTTR